MKRIFCILEDRESAELGINFAIASFFKGLSRR